MNELRHIRNGRLPTDKAGKLVGYKSKYAGRKWVKRFNQYGIPGLCDERRPGRPPDHTEDVRSAKSNILQAFH